MIPNTVGGLLLLVLFFVPGFLAAWVYERLVFSIGKTDLSRVFSSLCLSVTVWIVASPALWWYWRGHRIAWYHDWADANGTFHRDLQPWNGGTRLLVTVILVVFVLGPLLGFVAAQVRLHVLELSWVKKRLKLRPIDHRPTAWDGVFSEPDGRWIIVHLVDDPTPQYGIFGRKSYAGFSPQGQDLYLEALWWPDAEGGFLPNGKRRTSAYFPASQIRYIEFPRPAKEDAPSAGE